MLTAEEFSLSNLRIPGAIARDIGVKMVSGALRAGNVPEIETDASTRLKVSRTAYREAIRILVAKGLVNTKPKIGTRVSAREQWHLPDPDVLSWIFQAEPDYELVRRLFELRKMIEPEAAALAAERHTSQHLKAMASALEVMRRTKTVEKEWRDAAEQFHAALLDASSNPFLLSLTASINTAMSWSTIYKQRDGPLRRDPVPDHRRVYQAIAGFNSIAARQAMTRLVDLALNDIRVALGLTESTAVLTKRGKAYGRPFRRGIEHVGKIKGRT